MRTRDCAAALLVVACDGQWRQKHAGAFHEWWAAQHRGGRVFLSVADMEYLGIQIEGYLCSMIIRSLLQRLNFTSVIPDPGTEQWEQKENDGC